MESSSKFSYIDEFKVVKTLGSGYHAKVKLVEYGGKLFAVKRFKKETADLNTLKHELAIMSKLEHPNIVRLIDIRQSATYKKKNDTTYTCFVIILEYINGGELFEYISRCGRFGPDIARSYFHMLIDGLEYLHSKGIAHRDIKPENILLDSEFRLKITDFGFSTYLSRGTLHSKLGTEGYMAPEIRNKNYKGQQVDLFAAAVILFIMYSGNPPFEKAAMTDPYYKIFSQKNYKVFWGAHAKRKPEGFYTEPFMNLINKMLAFKPEERLTLEQIKNHQWYKGDILLLNDLNVQFSKRKAIIDAKLKEEKEEKQKKRQAMLNNQNTRDLNETDLVHTQAIKNVKFDASLMKVRKHKQLNNYQLVLKQDPAILIASLNELLLNPQENIVVDFEEATENYTVDLRESQPTIDITLQYDIMGVNNVLRVTVHLSKDQSDNLFVEFGIAQGSSLYGLKLINYLRNQFDYRSV